MCAVKVALNFLLIRKMSWPAASQPAARTMCRGGHHGCIRPGCMACSFSSADAGAGAVSGGGSNSMPSSKPSTFSIADIDSLAILPVPLPLPLPRCRYSAVAVKQPTSSRSSCACSLTDVAEASRTCSSQVANWPCPPCVLVATWLHLAVQVATWLKTTQPDSYLDACKTSR